MSESVRDYVTTYSFNKLEETAKTFRRLGEVYENAAEFKTADPGISRQLLLVADVLDECVTTHLYSEEIPKDIAKELFRRCFLSGVRIKNLSTIRNHHGAAELVMQARTVGRGCVSVKKILPIISEVFGLGYYLPGSDRTTIHEQFEQFIFIQESRFRMLTGVARRGKGCSKFNGDNFLISRLDCGKTTAAIADGMGSGKRAFIESRMVIELMENCIDAGFDEQHEQHGKRDK